MLCNSRRRPAQKARGALLSIQPEPRGPCKDAQARLAGVKWHPFPPSARCYAGGRSRLSGSSEITGAPSRTRFIFFIPVDVIGYTI